MPSQTRSVRRLLAAWSIGIAFPHYADALLAQVSSLRRSGAWPGPDPHAARAHDDKVANQLISPLPNQVHNHLWKPTMRSSRESKQDDSGVRVRVSVDQLTEVFVFSEEQPALAGRQLDDLGIFRSGSYFRDCDNLMAC